jgi:hypothetical protein
MITLKIPKIDSLRLLVPLNEVQIIDSKFLKTFISYCPETDEVDEASSHIKTQVYHENNGIKMRFAIAYLFNEHKEQTKYLAIGISAKMLKENYFSGINKNNIETVFNYINSLDIIKISKETFLNAKAVDIDFCIDFKLTNTTCKEVFSICYDLTIPSKNIKPNLFKEKTNRGIEWGKRNEVHKAYKTKQFLKYYAKVLELQHNSTDFYNAYIKENLNEKTLFADGTIFATDYNEDNILRVETTIKNPDHFATYGIYCKTLLDLLKTDLTLHSSMFNRPIQTYMNGYKTIQHNGNLTPYERVLIHSLDLIAKQMDLKPIDVIDVYVNSIFPINHETKPNVIKVQRSKFKKTLYELIEIDKKRMMENKTKNEQISMLEIQGFGLIPIS